ncbi:hypothetical protein KIN20_033588 [Parelaphostrongylus tenuis]|uniref:Uncharacterized protein n=1 Tax=Parelaphostrongylus tenuis TaxID=148309 RepID=A0AAD5R8B1_PARTN|nr:hypothetical protein KIN20_033588 [Parelaphostrongylus tenuis]
MPNITAKKAKEKFDELERIKVMPYLTYIPDAPSDCGLFRSMGNICVDADSRHLLKLKSHIRKIVIVNDNIALALHPSHRRSLL